MDTSILKNALSFLGGGWLSVALAVILVGLLIWWNFKKHAILVDAATKETEAKKIETEQGEQQKTRDQDATDNAGRKDVDEFLGKS